LTAPTWRRRGESPASRYHILDDGALAALHGGTASGPIVGDFGEELEKRSIETSAGDDPQRVRTAVAQLDIAHIGCRDRDRRVEDLLHQRIGVTRLNEPAAHLLKPSHRRQLGCKRPLAACQRVLRTHEVVDIVSRAGTPAARRIQ
jgi:hypothetical protein